MRISVRKTIGMGSTYSLDVEPSTTIGQLKQMWYEEAHTNAESAQGMCFTFDGDILDQDDQTLQSYGVEDQSNLEWVDINSTSRNIGNMGMKFVDVSNTAGLKRKAWSTKAPEWRRARHGLSLEGQCTTASCKAHKQQVVMPIGYTKFDFGSDDAESMTVCPLCKNYVAPVSCGFNNCWWRFMGKRVETPRTRPVRRVGDWTQADNAYHYFEQYSPDIVTWLNLTLEVVKKSPIVQPSG